MTFFNTSGLGKFPNSKSTASLFDPEPTVAIPSNNDVSHKTYAPSAPSKKQVPIGTYLPTVSGNLKSYYEAILQSELNGDRAEAFDAALAGELLKEACTNKELGNAIWLLQNGAEGTILQEIAAEGFSDQTFSKILEIHSKQPKAGSPSSPKDLDVIALELGYGYKTANLGIIQSELKGIEEKLKFCDLSVPDFRGISHHEIKYFLYEHLPELDKLWQSFLNTFPALQKEKFLQAEADEQVDMLIPENGKAILAEIQQKIAAVFCTNSFQHVALSELVDVSKPDWIIVRSTGREDSKDNANAGGNDSIPFIEPNHNCISHAIGNVVASYFGAKSIIQRLQAKDKTLFTAEPFMPVLLQKMICENNASGKGSYDIDIPCSGVLFTREQGKDPNVVTINAARGSNEGVVASQVATDTYQVHPHGVYSTIRVQPTRFVHIPKEGRPGFNVGPVLNTDKKVSHGPKLSSQMVSDLASLARELGKVYSETPDEVAPMDMEFTIKTEYDAVSQTKKTVIYPLQIRPLQETKSSAPSFLDKQGLEKLDPKGHKQVHGSTLLDGGSNVRTITNPELEVIIADDITEALHKYQHHEEVKEVKAILIRQSAPLTSHECVTLRPKGVPVIVVEDGEEFLRAQTLILEASDDQPALIGAQRSIIYHANSKEEAEPLIQAGLIAYPGPVELSIKNPSIMSFHPSKLDEAGLKVFLKSLDNGIDSLATQLGSDDPLKFKDATLSDLMDNMAMMESEEAGEALVAYLIKIRSLYYDVLGTKNSGQSLALELMDCMFRIVNLCKGHVRKALENEQPQSMERLFPLKHLLALTQQKSCANTIGGMSLLNLIHAIKNSAKFDPSQLGLPLTPLSKVLMTIACEGTKDEYKQKWCAFLKDVYKKQGEDGLKQLWAVLQRLNSLGLRSHWFNVTFQDYSNPTLNMVKMEINAQKEIFEALEKHHTALLGMQQSISSWADPEFFKKRFALFDKTFSSVGFDGKNPSSLSLLYNQGNELGKAAVLEFFHKSIEIYDESIKSVSGSGQYSSRKEQAKAFSQILVRYSEMLKTATEIAAPFQNEINMLDGHNAKESQKKHKLNEFQTYVAYLKEKDFNIQRTLNNPSPDPTVYYGKSLDTLTAQIESMSDEECAKLFEAREQFNVAAIALGSHTDLTFCIFWPRTLEELFTTHHQSMEALVKTMKTKIGMNKSRLPKEILPICDGIEKHTKQSISKMSVNKGILDVVYHIPFRSHASEVLIRTDLNRPELGYQIHMTVFGNEETNRWKTTGAFAALIAELPGCSFMYGAKPKINYLNPVGMGASFKYQMTPDFAYSAEFGLMFKNLLMPGGITFDSHDSSPFGLISGVASKPGFTQAFNHLKTPNDWLKLSEGFFANTLFPNMPLLFQAIETGECEAIKKIIRGTCLAMASYGHVDVNSDNIKSWGGFSGLFSNKGKVSINTLISNYSAEISPEVFTKLPVGHSYQKALLLSIYHLFKIDPEQSGEILLFLKSHPKTKNHFKSFIDLLDSLMKPVEDIIDDKLLAGHYLEALLAALKSQKKTLIDKTAQAWKAQTQESSLKDLAIALFNSLSYKTKEEAQSLAQELDLLHLMPEFEAYFEQLAKTSARKAYLANLQAIGAKVQSLGKKGPTIELIDYATQALIGLSQHPNFIGFNSGGGFAALSHYLSVEPYKGFLINNYHNNTTKLYKAATFYLLDALKSSDGAIKQKAKKAVKSLTADLKIHEETDPSSNHLKGCLFTIVAGYKHQHPAEDKTSSFLNKHLDLIQDFEQFWQKVMGIEAPSIAVQTPPVNPISDAVPLNPSNPIPDTGGLFVPSFRESCFNELGKLGEEIYTLGSFPEMPVKLFQLSAAALIGLSQDPKVLESSIIGKYFEGLGDYLGTPPYNQLIDNNQVNATRKILKAATFYLLKGMQSEKPGVAESAKEAFKEVVKDHLADGYKDVSGTHILKSIKAIITGFKLSHPIEDVKDLLQGDPGLLGLLANDDAPANPVEPNPKVEPVIGKSESSDAASRKLFLKSLDALGSELRALGLIPVSEKLLVRCYQTLIGLSQSTEFNFKSTTGNFYGLAKYLGVSPYDKFVEQNVHTTTTKLYKAAIFYIVAGLSSKHPAVFSKAAQVMKALVIDYLKYGHQDSSAKEYLSAIYGIISACEEETKNAALVPELLNHIGPLIQGYKDWKQTVN